MALIRGDLALKIASIVLALFLWMYLRTESHTIQVFEVPLELTDLPQDLALVGEIPDSVTVRVRASNTAYQSLSASRFRARLRLSGATTGVHSFLLTSDIVKAPLGVEVLDLEPESLDLHIERRTMREVPVVARIEGLPADGYENRGHTLTPRVATVEGPESLVRRVREVLAESVDIEGRSESLETVVSLSPDRGGVRIVSEGVATLRVDIEEMRMTRVWKAVPLEPRFPEGTDYRVEMQPDTIDVVLRGPEEALDAIRADDVRGVLDLEGMLPRETFYTVTPRIVIEPDRTEGEVTVQSTSEPTIRVRILR